VLEKQVDVGQFVSRGSLAARIYSVDYAEVRLPVALDQLAYLDLPFDYWGEGRPQSLPGVELLARFGTETFRWQGTIVRTEGEVDARSRMLHAVARIEQPYGREANSKRPPLSAGLFVEAMIEGRRVSGVHVLPREALRGRDRVYVVLDGKLNIRPVQVLRAERQVAVISEGLEDGEWVCISPLEMAVEGMPVRVAENGAPALNQTALNHQIAQQLP
jgi:multidrug efflux pump subunit AcrA (membrane-fusion protein)